MKYLVIILLLTFFIGVMCYLRMGPARSPRPLHRKPIILDGISSSLASIKKALHALQPVAFRRSMEGYEDEDEEEKVAPAEDEEVAPAEEEKVAPVEDEGEDPRTPRYLPFPPGHPAYRGPEPPQPPPEPSLWNYQGCFTDNQARVLKNNLGRANSVMECQNLAINAQKNVFGLQAGGECWADTDVSYDSLGPKQGCAPLGSDWGNQIYTSPTYVKRPPPPVGYDQFGIDSSESTPVNDYGGGSTIYLDRHVPNCGNRPLNRLQLSRPTENTMKFDYTCSRGGKMEAPVDLSTQPDDWGGGSTIYLDRHDIRCPENSALTKLHLARPSESTIKFEYGCAKNSTPLTCRPLTTEPRAVEDPQSLMTDIKCNSDEVLSRIHLTRPTPQTVAWEYSCCKQ